MTINSAALCGKAKNGKPLGFSNDCRAGSMQMGLWNQHRMKKEHHTAQQTKERGKKGPTCQSSALERFMCRKNRSWKHPRYQQVMEGLDRKQFQGKGKHQ